VQAFRAWLKQELAALDWTQVRAGALYPSAGGRKPAPSRKGRR
jgi:hypothetical protein